LLVIEHRVWTILIVEGAECIHLLKELVIYSMILDWVVAAKIVVT
jgi:hypothetical protein